MISLAQYDEQKAAGYNRIPLIQELLADLDTPLSIYLKLANQKFSYLLESVVGGERFGRYSFIGLPCHTYLKITGQHIEHFENHQLIHSEVSNPLTYIENFQAAFKTPDIPNLPRFTGGLVGYFGYESIQFFEPHLAQANKENPSNTPDIFLMLSQELAVVDNLSGKVSLIVYANTEEENGYQNARNRLEALRTQLRQSVALPLSLGSTPSEAISEVGAETFKSFVNTVKDYILAGDCMQVVPSQRLSMPFHDNPLSLYRALRTLNPSPYMYFYHFDDFHVVGSSPEILVRKEQKQVVVRPIAGTRLRGKDSQEDLELEHDLLNDQKEIAEHVMLIDLGRNDLGRICEVGSVKVSDKMAIERYSHVMHIVSNVEGRLKDDVSNMQILSATFPAGTLSGAPKIRAMQIIEELEPTKRGVYGGAVGYLGFNGDMDFAIAIRTAIIREQMLYVQSGAGVVADSNAESEWEETQNKARAIITAAKMVQAGLDL